MSQDLVFALTAWDWQPSVLIGVALLVGAYLGAIGPWRTHFRTSRPVERAQVIWFLLGAFVILFALVSPLDDLGDEYLFSAHMVQHLLLMLVAPPMILMGTPGWMLRPLLRYPAVARTARTLTTPVMAFALFNADMLAWHFPVFYEATLRSETIHIVEHLLFIATGVLNWWPILSPLPELPRLPYPGQILYLALETVPTAALSALLVFSSTVLYPTYAAAPRLFGLSALSDQQIGGLIMWVPGGLFYLGVLTAVFNAWFGQEEHAGDKEPA
jgi:putative membrane protein